MKKGDKQHIPVDLLTGSFTLNFANEQKISKKIVFDKLAKDFLGKSEQV